LNKKQWEIYKKEIRKVDISCKLYEGNNKIVIELYNDNIFAKSCIEKEEYNVSVLDNERIETQIRKTGNTIFNIKDIDICIENLRLPISKLNDLRRSAIDEFDKELENSILRKYNKEVNVNTQIPKRKTQKNAKINLYLQKFDKSIDYSKFEYNEIYVQFKDLIENSNIRDCVAVLPTIIDETYENLIIKNRHIFEKVKAVQISHISQIELLKKLDVNKKIFADYTFNITNKLSEEVVRKFGVERITISPELDKKDIDIFGVDLEKEIVVYGRTCLMTSKYCPIGKNDNCHKLCQKDNYTLEDRKKFIFPIVSDCINCHSRIYNSKILSIENKEMDADFVRIDILDENENQIEKIISVVKTGKRFSGIEYTNGNF